MLSLGLGLGRCQRVVIVMPAPSPDACDRGFGSAVNLDIEASERGEDKQRLVGRILCIRSFGWAVRSLPLAALPRKLWIKSLAFTMKEQKTHVLFR